MESADTGLFRGWVPGGNCCSVLCCAGQCDDEENTFLYDLVVTVAHVLDPRTGGNLVAHIKVGETYHQRKEGVTHKQWYLFNDFLIEPIDKCDPVQFDLSWKIPCSLYYARRNLNSRHDLTSR
uniref:PAB-dependent poly(A)-specific ribonuclease subunit PAN2-like n=1 Tax=Callorhinchus milii TaxID=7868 RepID=A0A4W3GU88_CALMI